MNYYFNKTENVNLSNWRKPPYNRWAFSNVCELVPSSIIRNDPLNTGALSPSSSNINEFSIYDGDKQLDLEQWIDATYGDGLIIIKDGNIVHESYSGATDVRSPHILMSVSKSILGLIVGILEKKGSMNLSDTVEKIIPEMKNTAYAGATIRDVLDMRVGVLFEENYEAQAGPIIEYRKSHLWDPLPVGENPSDLKSFISSLNKSDGNHNDRFHYVSPNSDLLGLLVEEVTGVRYSTLMSDLLWKPLGAEEDAYITVDSKGAPRCAGGHCAALRDLAKVGLAVARGGSLNGREIIPSTWIDDIIHNGSKEAWDKGDFFELFSRKNMHYRSQWYVERGENPLIFAVGVFGQNLFIDPNNDLVIAKLSSQPTALEKPFLDLTHQGIDKIREIFI